MKRLIYNSESNNSFNWNLDNIVSITLEDDAESSYPRNSYIFNATKLNYSSLTREQLLQLPKKELERIHDINALRKLNKDELTVQQYIEVRQANDADSFDPGTAKIREVLTKLKQCDNFYISPTKKNNSFRQKLKELGGRITDEDVESIIHGLHVSDFVKAKYSYLDESWNSLLLIFGYHKPYTFSPQKGKQTGVTIDDLEIYVKIDIDNETGDGYVVLSFHPSEEPLKYPHSDFPIDKE